MRDNTDRKWIVFSRLLAGAMPAGILIYSAILFAINRIYPPAATSSPELLAARISLRHAAETAVGICTGLFQLGGILLIWYLIRRGRAVPFRLLLPPFFAAVGAMFLCALPFALLDRAFWGDYLFPIWGRLVTVALLLLILSGVNLYLCYRARN